MMLYNRNSINYYVEIMFLRRLFRWCLLPKFMPRLISAATGFDRWKLEGHRDFLKKKGFKRRMDQHEYGWALVSLSASVQSIRRQQLFSVLLKM